LSLLERDPSCLSVFPNLLFGYDMFRLFSNCGFTRLQVCSSLRFAARSLPRLLVAASCFIVRVVAGHLVRCLVLSFPHQVEQIETKLCDGDPRRCEIFWVVSSSSISRGEALLFAPPRFLLLVVLLSRPYVSRSGTTMRREPTRRAKYRGCDDSTRRRSTTRAPFGPTRRSPTRRIIASSVFRPTRRLPTEESWSRQMDYEGSSLLGCFCVRILIRR
jgi:hypothetical protein